jgi:hypothetical protein
MWGGWISMTKAVKVNDTVQDLKTECWCHQCQESVLDPWVDGTRKQKLQKPWTYSAAHYPTLSMEVKPEKLLTVLNPFASCQNIRLGSD